jgi:hypothetical protein
MRFDRATELPTGKEIRRFLDDEREVCEDMISRPHGSSCGARTARRQA